MSTQGNAPTLTETAADTLRADDQRLALPSWTVSVGLHGLLLILVATSLKSCGGGGMNTEDGDKFRTVGLVDKQVRQPIDRPADDPQDDAHASADQNAQDRRATSDPFRVDDSPPVELALPKSKRPILGAGRVAVPESRGPTDISELVKPSGGLRQLKSDGLADGETEFFGIRDKGGRFTYMLDRSGSMRGLPMQVAKLELMASLEALKPTQQFEVIFYSNTPHVMKIDGKSLLWATKLNRTKARQEIGSIDSDDGGTRHVSAFLAAFESRPEVIYFLTDGENFDRRRLESIRQANRSDARIHCIQFGSAPRPPVLNYLKRLAADNGGAYRYRDVRQFRRR